MFFLEILTTQPFWNSHFLLNTGTKYLPGRLTYILTNNFSNKKQCLMCHSGNKYSDLLGSISIALLEKATFYWLRAHTLKSINEIRLPKLNLGDSMKKQWNFLWLYHFGNVYNDPIMYRSLLLSTGTEISLASPNEKR